MADPDRWTGAIDPRTIDGAAWAALVFGASETAVALLTSTPGSRRRQRAHESPDRGRRATSSTGTRARGGCSRTRSCTPTSGESELDAMVDWQRDAAAGGLEVLHALGSADEGVADRWLVPRRRRGGLPVPRTRARARAAGRRDAQRPRRSHPRGVGRGRVAARHRSRGRAPSPTSRSSSTTRATSAIPTARKAPYDPAGRRRTAGCRPARPQPRRRGHRAGRQRVRRARAAPGS